MMLQEAFGKELAELKEKMVEVFVHQVIHLKVNEGNEHIFQYSTLLDVNLHTDRVCLLIDINNLSERISAEKGNDGLFEDFPLQYFQRDVLDFLNLILIENNEDIVSVLNFERFIIIKSLPFSAILCQFYSS